VQLVTEVNVMDWRSLRCWQPRQLVFLPGALSQFAWEYLKNTQPHPRPAIARFISKLEVITVHAPVMPELLIQVMSSSWVMFQLWFKHSALLTGTTMQSSPNSTKVKHTAHLMLPCWRWQAAGIPINALGLYNL
jgi:hypothetical protein